MDDNTMLECCDNNFQRLVCVGGGASRAAVRRQGSSRLLREGRIGDVQAILCHMAGVCGFCILRAIYPSRMMEGTRGGSRDKVMGEVSGTRNLQKDS